MNSSDFQIPRTLQSWEDRVSHPARLAIRSASFTYATRSAFLRHCHTNQYPTTQAKDVPGGCSDVTANEKAQLRVCGSRQLAVRGGQR